jgi:hypothetical protein
LLGVPVWPLWINDGFPGIQLDALVLGICQILVNGVPFLRQVTQNDKGVSFESVTPEEHLEDAEAMWRAWYHRSAPRECKFVSKPWLCVQLLLNMAIVLSKCV